MGKNQELYNLANELIKLDEFAKEKGVLDILLSYQKNSLIHYIINNSPYCAKGIEAYLEKDKVKSLSLSSIIIKLLGGFKKDVLRERFLLADNVKDIDKEIKKEFKKYPRVIATDTARRKAILEKFISNGDMEINFEKDRFYNLLEKYLICVYEWRNKFNHAAAKNGCKKTSDTIKSEIIEAIALIKEQNA
jgi:hypothetical protein